MTDLPHYLELGRDPKGRDMFKKKRTGGEALISCKL